MSTATALLEPTPVEDPNGKIVCAIDGGLCDSIRVYLKQNYPDWTVDRYKKEFPGSPLLSEKGKRAALKAKEAADRKAAAQAFQPGQAFAFAERSLAEIFDLDASTALSSTGNPIMLRCLTEHHPEADAYINPSDPDYVFNIDLVKKVCLGFELGMNVYLWGYHGTGKTTVLEQCAARTGRPFLRVQHTGNTEEAHILGQYVVKTIMVDAQELGPDGRIHAVKKPQTVTEFQYGPLAMAMKYGMVYCADEYDFAMPSVIALYQPVLEGKPLVIKDAPIDQRVIHPHPDFRFVATGNTNGVGDETGLYQGTMIQNAASYSRFHITEEVKYMDAKQEALVLRSKAGLGKPDAEKFVKVANAIRESFAKGEMSMTISPRELITAASLTIVFGNNPTLGFKLAFINRCSRIDQVTVEQVVQRHFA
ncbi:AAA domain-containing protein [Rhizobium bangladeshense]|uniref:AAA family ATPase n=1 Tax=Rhizobium bangladeshense TaxID=1138189 RepID=UPI001C82B4B4|nr:MoxR family ATPase [Rhizobium bangladeshense]MBX4911398.1 AAA domain-containing protein [Rhizobium bangladeshense]